MNKHLLAAIITPIAFLTITSPTFAETKTYPAERKFEAIWQKLTLRDLLRQQVRMTEATPTPIKRVLTPTPTKSSTTIPETTSDVTAYIMKEINAYRASQGLSAVQTNKETCDFAKIRAQEIATNFTHDGFMKRKESKTLPYTNWSAITENIAMTSNYKDVVSMWKNSSGHAANMRADTPYVCVIQNSNYYAYEGMKP